jgi:pyruvate ferredoxin oxidoreductase delta subunit
MSNILDEKEMKNDGCKGFPVSSPENDEPATGSWRTATPIVDLKKCIKCRTCWLGCPEAAIVWENGPVINYKTCKGCLICWRVCPAKAIAKRDIYEK